MLSSTGGAAVVRPCRRQRAGVRGEKPERVAAIDVVGRSRLGFARCDPSWFHSSEPHDCRCADVARRGSQAAARRAKAPSPPPSTASADSLDSSQPALLGVAVTDMDPAAIQRSAGAIIAIPQVGGLHHRYERAAEVSSSSRSRELTTRDLRHTCFVCKDGARRRRSMLPADLFPDLKHANMVV